jgi:Apea-like HEPN
MGQSGIALIANRLEVSVTLPAQIAPGLRLRRSEGHEQHYLHDVLVRTSPEWGVPATWAYECDWVLQPSGGHQPVNLPPAQWRYFVVEYEGDRSTVRELMLAANLSEPPLDSAVEIVMVDGQLNGHTVYGNKFENAHYGNAYSRDVDRFDEAALQALIASYQAFARFDASKHLAIRRALDLFETLKVLPAMHESRILWLFAIIEMLFTHNPNDKEFGDSLSHQLATKIPLVSERLPTPIDYFDFPSGWPPGKVWKQLYNYRSKIAHGGELTYQSGDLKWLRDVAVAEKFLTRATRLLLRYALDEPTLVDALKPI